MIACGFDPDLLCLPKLGAQSRQPLRLRVFRKRYPQTVSIHSSDPYGKRYGSNGIYNSLIVNSRIDLNSCHSVVMHLANIEL